MSKKLSWEAGTARIRDGKIQFHRSRGPREIHKHIIQTILYARRQLQVFCTQKIMKYSGRINLQRSRFTNKYCKHLSYTFLTTLLPAQVGSLNTHYVPQFYLQQYMYVYIYTFFFLLTLHSKSYASFGKNYFRFSTYIKFPIHKRFISCLSP